MSHLVVFPKKNSIVSEAKCGGKFVFHSVVTFAV